MTTYNVITLPYQQLGVEATTVAQEGNYNMALNSMMNFVQDQGGGELEPLQASGVAALTLYTPLQAWKYRDKALLIAIQVADEEMT